MTAKGLLILYLVCWLDVNLDFFASECLLKLHTMISHVHITYTDQNLSFKYTMQLISYKQKIKNNISFSNIEWVAKFDDK